jgi:hypothetical protein
VDLQPASSEGGAAEPQSNISLEMAVAYLNEREELMAARFAASKDSANKDPILGCADNFAAVPAGNTAATVEAGLGGGM